MYCCLRLVRRISSPWERLWDLGPQFYTAPAAAALQPKCIYSLNVCLLALVARCLTEKWGKAGVRLVSRQNLRVLPGARCAKEPL